jgi:cathepsin B
MKTLVILSVALLLVVSAELILPRSIEEFDDKLSMHKDDLSKFIKGFLKGSLLTNYKDLKSCLKKDKLFSDNIIEAVKAFTKQDKREVHTGLKHLSQGLQLIPEAMKNCNFPQEEVDFVAKIIKDFQEPNEFEFHFLKKFKLNTIEIGQNIIDACAHFYDESFAKAGFEFGAAIGRVYFGSIKANDPEFLKQLEQIDKTWEATTYSEFENLSLDEFRKTRLGGRQRHGMKGDDLPVANYDDLVNAVPTNFDARTQWPKCIQAIRNQQSCGSCWAFASAEPLGDRFCIATNGTVSKVLSPQYLVSCDKTELGCNGGYLNKVWAFLEASGTVTDSCWPYKSGGGSVPACSLTKCEDGQPIKKYYAKKGTSKWLTTPATIQTEIFANGPVETGFTVYQDFMYYKSGIYVYKSGVQVGGHAVKIIGWGVTTAGQKYWIVANSWATTWGEQGFFRIQQGQCGIDADGIAGLADTTRI